MKYRINGALEPLKDQDLPLKSGAYIDVLTTEEVGNHDLSMVPHIEVMRHNLESIRFCKAEEFDDCIIGTLKIPVKPNVTQKFLSVAFLIQAHRLVFITKDTDLDDVIREIRLMKVIRSDTVGSFFSAFLMQCLQDDVAFLTSLEDGLIGIEDGIFTAGRKSGNLKKFQNIRRSALRMSTYYQQLADMAEILTGNDNRLFTEEECGHFRLFRDRCSRLYGLTSTIREYGMQLHELQQAEIQNRQNVNMGRLTVITAIFLPLTLLVGWYGMNFNGMPELSSRYGYLGVIIVSVAIVVAEIIFFRKNHFFD